MRLRGGNRASGQRRQTGSGPLSGRALHTRPVSQARGSQCEEYLTQASGPSQATGQSTVRTTAQGAPGRPDLHGSGCQGQVTLGTTFRRYRAAQVSSWIAGTTLCTWK